MALFQNLTRQQRIAYVMIGVLAVIFFGVLLYMQVLRGALEVPVETARPTSVEGLKPGVAAQEFQTDILADPRYQALDRGLLDQGRLPVPPPQGRGKPNLF